MNMQQIDDDNGTTAAALTLFDDRYGVGALQRLLNQLQQPCVTFAQIAADFGVTRERVRQWQALYRPDAPTGRERRRMCQLQNAKRRLLADAMFRGFYRRARETFGSDHVMPIRTRDGLRTRAARLQGHLVLIKKARRRSGVHSAAAVYVLPACRRAADFVFYQLDTDGFLFVPLGELPSSGTTCLVSPASKYSRYHNSFAALTGSDRTAA